MASKQVLSIEQMKHLQELGLDTSNATLTWILYPASIRGDVIPTLKMWRWEQIKDEQKKVCVPAFTLQDILDKLPHYLKSMISEKILYAWVLERDTIAYRNVEDVNDCLKLFIYNTLIDAAYEMLCWCIENGYIKELKNK